MGGLIIFLLLQVVVNYVLKMVLAPFITSIYGVLAYYMLSSLIISFIGAFMNTPAPYKKDCLKQPAFHKIMLTYFAIFLAIDLIFYFL